MRLPQPRCQVGNLAGEMTLDALPGIHQVGVQVDAFDLPVLSENDADHQPVPVRGLAAFLGRPIWAGSRRNLERRLLETHEPARAARSSAAVHAAPAVVLKVKEAQRRSVAPHEVGLSIHEP